MTWRSRLAGYYAILDRDDANLANLLVNEDGCGARVLQLRIKGDTLLSAAELCRIGREVRLIAHRAGALFIVNDRLDLALATGADGVHIGQQDIALADVREILAELGSEMIVGVSTHDDEQVARAVEGGADYLGFGPVFPTPTKLNPDAVQGIEGLARAVAIAGDVPVVGIGGITPTRVTEVAATGAAAACAIASVNDAAEPVASGRAIAAAFRSPT